MDHIVIVAAARTALGGFQGAFRDLAAADLGGAAIQAAVAQTGLDPAEIDHALMGCVLPAGQGQAPARQAAFKGGLPESVPCVTVNKMCGSGLQTVMQARDLLRAGEARAVVAGGMESMTAAPYLLPKMRGGARLGHSHTYDHMFLDGLEDAYEPGRLMGAYAEDCADRYGFTREDQDAYALASLSRATAAAQNGWFDAEITPVTVKTRRGETVTVQDEQPLTARPDKIPHLKPAFRPGGTVTAANASSISDGAAALVLMRESDARAAGAPMRARLIGQAFHAQAPGLFTTAPIPAARKALAKAGWSAADIDLWEVNEAFAVVPMAFMRDMNVDHARMNVHGGACALGHPIGASGARILVTLLHALERADAARGVASICIGGGEGAALAIERV